MRTIEQRLEHVKLNRHRYSPKRLLKITKQLNKERAYILAKPLKELEY